MPDRPKRPMWKLRWRAVAVLAALGCVAPPVAANFAPANCVFSPGSYSGTGPVRHAEYGYMASGLRQSVKDANDNLSTLIYDGHDRLRELRFPLPTKGALASSTTDYEQYSYDANGNRLTLAAKADRMMSPWLAALSGVGVRARRSGRI